MINPISEEQIRTAYLLLKNYFYYDSTDLFVKKQIAEYESKNGYNPKLIFKNLVKDISNIINNPEDTIEVDFHILPKNIDVPILDNEKNNIQFISNFKEQDNYKSKVNYFIDVNIPLRVLDVIWTTTVGKQLDANLSDTIYAHRLQDVNLSDIRFGNVLFKKYTIQYSSWRDNALKMAKNLLEQKQNVIIMSLDLKSFFYSIQINFDKLKKINVANNFSNIIEIIHKKYYKKIHSFLKITHKDNSDTMILPIGLLSSGILANWHLTNFDVDILTKLNPSYYGRYVDDILLIKHTNKSGNLTESDCIDECFGTTFFQKDNDELLKYKKDDINITIQKDKFIIHYLDKNHSSASLKIFETEINQNNSMFRFLPTTDSNANLEDVAYDLFYYGSKYRFRSIINFKENSTKFSTYLSSQLILHRLTKTVNNKFKITDDVNKFFKGRNFFDFSRFWLKYFYFLVVINDMENIKKFYKDISKIIKKVHVSDWTENTHDHKIDIKIKHDLNEYLEISKGLAFALLKKDKMSPLAASFRESNIFNNDFITFPLVNFTNYQDSLIKINLENFDYEELSDSKILLSPKFIHLDEYFLFHTKTNLYNGERINYEHIISKYNKQFYSSYTKTKDYYNINNMFSKVNTNTVNTDILKINIKDSLNKNNKKNHKEKKFNEKIRIGLVNTKILEKQIRKSYINNGTDPDLSLSRQDIIYNLLNSAVKEDVDMLIFPELAIPYKWLPQMLQFSRRNQISLVFGLEYIISTKNSEAYNYVVTTLPFIKGKYKTLLPVIRLKNHYAPKEEEKLIDHKYNIPKQNYTYNLFNWNGLAFTTFICFEMADILHRSLFKLNLDLLTCCVWNPDIKYYDNMLYSTVRDLHCYIAQTNTSQYGNSCILQPKKSEEYCMVNIKGGNNSTLITEDLDIAAIKYYHSLKQNTQNPLFKPMPPGKKNKL